MDKCKNCGAGDFDVIKAGEWERFKCQYCGSSVWKRVDNKMNIVNIGTGVVIGQFASGTNIIQIKK